MRHGVHADSVSREKVSIDSAQVKAPDFYTNLFPGAVDAESLLGLGETMAGNLMARLLAPDTYVKAQYYEDFLRHARLLTARLPSYIKSQGSGELASLLYGDVERETAPTIATVTHSRGLFIPMESRRLDRSGQAISFRYEGIPNVSIIQERVPYSRYVEYIIGISPGVRRKGFRHLLTAPVGEYAAVNRLAFFMNEGRNRILVNPNDASFYYSLLTEHLSDRRAIEETLTLTLNEVPVFKEFFFARKKNAYVRHRRVSRRHLLDAEFARPFLAPTHLTMFVHRNAPMFSPGMFLSSAAMELITRIATEDYSVAKSECSLHPPRSVAPPDADKNMAVLYDVLRLSETLAIKHYMRIRYMLPPRRTVMSCGSAWPWANLRAKEWYLSGSAFVKWDYLTESRF